MFRAEGFDYFFVASAAGAVVLLLLDEAAGVLLGAAVELEDEDDVSGAFVASDEAGGVGAGATDVEAAVDAGGVAGAVVTVLDFCSVHADTASVSAAATKSDLYMFWFPR